jgi:hypothetical protein
VGDSWIRVSHGCAPMTEESSGSTRGSYVSTRMQCPQESATFWHSSRPSCLVGPLEHAGGVMASLDPYHLGLVLAVLWHTGWGSGPTGIPQSFDNRELDPRKTRLASAGDD